MQALQRLARLGCIALSAFACVGIKYHYSGNPGLAGGGLWAGASGTPEGALYGQTEASQRYGIPPPTYRYPVLVDPKLLGPPRIVPASNRYTGGGTEVDVLGPTPAGSIGPPTQVPVP